MANTRYTEQEDKELNAALKKLQNRAKRLILSDYYESVSYKLSDLQVSILQSITNAESHNDINFYLWNSGMLDTTLDTIADKIKQVRKDIRNETKRSV